MPSGWPTIAQKPTDQSADQPGSPETYTNTWQPSKKGELFYPAPWPATQGQATTPTAGSVASPTWPFTITRKPPPRRNTKYYTKQSPKQSPPLKQAKTIQMAKGQAKTVHMGHRKQAAQPKTAGPQQKSPQPKTPWERLLTPPTMSIRAWPSSKDSKDKAQEKPLPSHPPEPAELEGHMIRSVNRKPSRRSRYSPRVRPGPSPIQPTMPPVPQLPVTRKPVATVEPVADPLQKEQQQQQQQQQHEVYLSPTNSETEPMQPKPLTVSPHAKPPIPPIPEEQPTSLPTSRFSVWTTEDAASVLSSDVSSILEKGDGTASMASALSDSEQARYLAMLLRLDTIPRLHNILANLFAWLLLASFLMYPGTFTNARMAPFAAKAYLPPSKILDDVTSRALVVVATLCCATGLSGLAALAVCWRNNYVWLLNRVYLPGFLAGLSGLVATLVGVYAQQHGEWSVAAKASISIAVILMTLSAALFVLYNQVLRGRLRSERKSQKGRSFGGIKGVKGSFSRMTRGKSLVPGSVI